MSSQPAEYTDLQQITLNPDWEYADHSKINTGAAVLYRAPEESGSKGIIIGVNAGHGTAGGAKVKTLCHPDGFGQDYGRQYGSGSYGSCGSVRRHDISGRDTGANGYFADGTDSAGQTVGLRL